MVSDDPRAAIASVAEVVAPPDRLRKFRQSHIHAPDGSEPEGDTPNGQESTMKTRTRISAAIAGTGLAAGLALASGGIAGAAHGGALTEGSFSGRAEVASDATSQRIVGDPNGRGEAYVFSTGGGVICYVLNVDKIDPAIAAHIHEAPAGENGPVVIALSAPTDGSSAGCIDTGDADLAADIALRDSSNYYVNVHNETYPGGAIRAQLGN
jgi:hypothetical protein